MALWYHGPFLKPWLLGRNWLGHMSHQLNRNPYLLMFKPNLCTNTPLSCGQFVRLGRNPSGKKQNCAIDPFSFRWLVNDWILVLDEVGDPLHSRQDRNIKVLLSTLMWYLTPTDVKLFMIFIPFGMNIRTLYCRNTNMLHYGLLSAC